MKKYLVLALCALSLTGCVSRPQADERLAMGCAAAVEMFLTDSNKIKEIKHKRYGTSAEGAAYRDVTLQYVESDGWADVDKEAKCTFTEQFGFLGTSYTADIYQVKVNDQVYGKQGNELIGSYEDMSKLTEAVSHAINRE